MSAAFQFTAIDRDGKKIRGVREARSRDSVIEELERENLVVTRIEEAAEDAESSGLSIKLPGLRRVSSMDLVLFNRRLATLTASGIPLMESLQAISNQVENDEFRKTLSNVTDRVRHGASFSEALEAHPGLFPELMIAMVRVGETGGILAPILEQLADFTERDAEVRGEVAAALAYPAIVVLLAVATVVFLLSTIVPKLATMFESMEAQLPLPTQILMATSALVTGYWPILVMAALALAGSFVYITRTPAGREFLDRAKLSVPVAGAVIKKSMIARFARSLGALVKGGVPLMEGLRVVNRVLNNQVLSLSVDRIMDAIRRGDSLTQGISREPIFPEMVKYMISAGEDSGNLDEMLFKVADIYELETRQAIRIAISLLTPGIILVVAALVGFIAFAMLLPIFQINQMVG